MEGDFTAHKQGWYTPQLVAEIDGFEPDQYGNKWYNVVMSGNAETFMWLAKNEPEEGKKYYGHIEPTKSGKRLRFKTDKVPEGSAPSSSAHSKTAADYEPGTNARWAIGLAYRAYKDVMGTPESGSGGFPFDLVLEHATALVEMFDKLKNSGSHGSSPSIETISSATQVEQSPSPATSSPVSLRSAWEERKDLPKKIVDTFGDGTPLPDEGY